jgi:pimeloyl-ACP methyl ester carboxylesterase
MTKTIRNDSMNASNLQYQKGYVIALHCSLGSGRQWTRLTAELGPSYQVIAPDISGYGSGPGPADMPKTLAEEVAHLGTAIDRIEGPIHLVGHSYGGAIAFKIATASRFVDRVRSLTLIEPVLPTLLKENPADRRLHDLFAQLAQKVSADLWNGMYMEAVDRFLSYWNGSGPAEQPSAEARLHAIEHVEKVAYDFAAALSEENVTSAAAAISVPTLLLSGGLSPYLTQRIVGRLTSTITTADAHHFPSAGHMLPLTHAKFVNPRISAHIQRADDFAIVSLASELETSNWPASGNGARTEVVHTGNPKPVRPDPTVQRCGESMPTESHNAETILPCRR